MRKSGFTLIELLVVIAIIAILAAILFPVFAKAREKARQASCESNLKQMGVAARMYVQDYDEKWAAWDAGASAPTPPADTNRNFWRYQYQPYIKNWQIFVCPSASPGDPSAVTNQLQLAYGQNEILRGMSEAQFNYPAELMAFADSRHWDSNQDGRVAYANACAANCTPANRVDSNARHNAGENAVFADGHAKWMQCTTIFGTMSTAGNRMLNP